MRGEEGRRQGQGHTELGSWWERGAGQPQGLSAGEAARAGARGGGR